MMKYLERVCNSIDRFTEAIGSGTSWLSFVLILCICTDVLMRYIFNITFIALYELEWHLFAILFLVGAGYTLKHDRHVRVDVFYNSMSKKQKAWVNFLGSLLFLLPFCLIAIKGSVPYVETSFKLDEGSNDAGGLPARYLIKSTIIIGFFFLMLQGISMLLRSLITILRSNPKTQ